MKLIKTGIQPPPDMKDYDAIRQAAQQNKVVLLSAWDLKNGSFDEILANQDKIINQIHAALEALGFKKQTNTAEPS